ncbi:uncharacterized protein VTP21DRAFT_8283 [Calcarisporiella thermophila]|uniref:uncharacterized protein n=1 Tax=Calcarisporiella thermophila TaxID=911321 RepID=UPI0037423D49
MTVAEVLSTQLEASSELKEIENIVRVVQNNAKVIPNRPYIMYGSDNGEYTNYTFKQFDNVTTSEALYWSSKLNTPERSARKVVALLLTSSHYIPIIVIALAKLNIVPLLLSVRNSPEAIRHLAKEAGAFALIHDVTTEPLAKTAMQKDVSIDIQAMHYPDLTKEVLDQEVDGAEVVKNDQRYHNDFAILHSSGSTAFPKLITVSHHYILLNGAARATSLYPPVPSQGVYLLMGPHFHFMGINSMIGIGHSQRTTIALLLAKSFPPRPEDVFYSLEKSGADFFTSTPSILEQLVKLIESNPSWYGWDTLRRLNYLSFGGSACPKELGDKITANGVNLVSAYGSTETGILMYGDFRGSKHWSGMKLHPSVHVKWVEVPNGEKGEYELVVLSSSPHSADKVANLPGGEYATRDVFIERDGWMYFQYRLDDTLVHVNGEKTNPLPIEESLRSHPLIDNACVVGAGRFCTAALIQLHAEEAERLPLKQVLEQVKLAIHHANRAAPQHSQVVDEMVYILPLRGKRLSTTDKGSIKRRGRNGVANGNSSAEHLLQDKQALRHKLTSLIAGLTNHPVTNTPEFATTSFFDIGMDSLMAIRFRNQLTQMFPSLELAQNVVYTYNSVGKLADHLCAKANRNASDDPSDYDAQQLQATRDLISKYSDFSHIQPKFTSTSDHFSLSSGARDEIVLVTGASGSLGNFLVRDLLRLNNVRKVYCLLRGDDGMERMHQSFAKRQLDASILNTDRVEALEYNMGDAYLGQTQEVYSRLAEEVTTIIHCAWKMDFNVPVEAFESESVASVYHLIALACASSTPKRILFTSSVSSSGRVPTPTIPELPLPEDKPEIAVPMGYGRSKYAAEIILQRAARELSIPVNLLRVGQVSGDSENGAWNMSEMWSMMLYCGSSIMHAMPDLGSTEIDWIPVDVASRSIVEIGVINRPPLQDSAHGPYYLVSHFVNPKHTAWNEVLNSLQKLDLIFDIVSFDAWVELLKNGKWDPEVRSPCEGDQTTGNQTHVFYE